MWWAITKRTRCWNARIERPGIWHSSRYASTFSFVLDVEPDVLSGLVELVDVSDVVEVSDAVVKAALLLVESLSA